MLYRLENFEKDKIFGVPHLDFIQIMITSQDVITQLKIVSEWSSDGDKNKNAAFILFGTDRGHLNMFDLISMRKF